MRYILKHPKLPRRKGILEFCICHETLKLNIHIGNGKKNTRKGKKIFKQIAKILCDHYRLYDLKKMSVKGAKKGMKVSEKLRVYKSEV